MMILLYSHCVNGFCHFDLTKKSDLMRYATLALEVDDVHQLTRRRLISDGVFPCFPARMHEQLWESVADHRCLQILVDTCFVMYVTVAYMVSVLPLSPHPLHLMNNLYSLCSYRVHR